MAKRRMGKRGSFKGGFRKFGRRASRSGSTENLMIVGIAAAGYGFGRPYLEKLIAPVTSKIPVVGQYADEVVLGTVGYLAAKGKLGSNKYIKAIGKAMFIVEATRVGSSIGSGMISSSTTSDYNY